MPMKIDLHSHTRYSDGKLSVDELLMRAHTMMLDVLAITDHDSVAAIEPAIRWQTEQKRPMRIVPGVELSCAWHGFDIHILGFQINHQCPTFLARLEEQSQRRVDRAERICAKLEKAGIQGVLPEAMALAQLPDGAAGQITRAHIARALVNRGEVIDFDQAFKKYLGKGKKAHVKPDWISIEKGISWIKGAGGQAVLAHPGRYDLSAKWLRRLVSEFAAFGGQGLELSQGQLALQKWQFLAELAKEHKLMGSVGSDFHGPSRWCELGRNLRLPDNIQPLWHDWPIN